MRIIRSSSIVLALAMLASCAGHLPAGVSTVAPPATPPVEAGLPSWNDTPAKHAIVDFVARVTRPDSPEYVPPEARVAVFDNDGTLWVEQPAYTQFVFALQRVQQLSPQHPEWKTQEPFRSVLKGDMAGVAASGEEGVMKLLAATHAGMTTDAFGQIVHNWFTTAKDRRFDRPYTALAYQPMIEVLRYLEANGFTNYIVTGGGVEFVRAISETVYAIPPEHVIGSTVKYKYGVVDGVPTLTRLAQIANVDDGPGKPQTIQAVIGRRPVMAFGNSDGDQQMLEWTAAGRGARFAAIVHHTDATREYAYDRTSKIGKLDKALDEANSKGWTVIDMQSDWKTIFVPAGSPAAAPAPAN
jgi:phosphoglycolate phosphatase-like HAD superfamily hydrolase